MTRATIRQKGAAVVLSTPGRTPVKSQQARTRTVVSEGRYKITALPDGSLEISWQPDGPGERGVLFLPAMVGRLIERADKGEKISPAMVLRAMRG